MPTGNTPVDAFFAAFDEQFRGSRADIKMRLHVYLRHRQASQGGHELITRLSIWAVDVVSG